MADLVEKELAAGRGTGSSNARNRRDKQATEAEDARESSDSDMDCEFFIDSSDNPTSLTENYLPSGNGKAKLTV